jgi:hypothetical protein
MNRLVDSLAPVLIASFALQQLIELLEPILDMFIKAHKKWILSVVTLVVGLLLAVGLQLRVLGPIGYSGPVWADVLISALVISGGTRWINDLLKLLGYRKETARLALNAKQNESVDTAKLGEDLSS